MYLYIMVTVTICAFIILILHVFGKKLFETAPSIPTAELAQLIMKQYHLNDEQLPLYTRHFLYQSCKS